MSDTTTPTIADIIKTLLLIACLVIIAFALGRSCEREKHEGAMAVKTCAPHKLVTRINHENMPLVVCHVGIEFVVREVK